MFQSISTCSLHSLPARSYLFESWMLATWCYLVHFTNFVLEHPFLRIAGSIAVLILIINIRSFPVVWHWKVILPWGLMRCQYRIASLRHTLLLRPFATRHEAVITQLESRCPVGANPFEFVITTRSWATPDEMDFLGHLSNSTYAKSRDLALSRFAAAAWPIFMNAGGWVALASTQYHFLREIPWFARYEMTMSIGAWDHKWLYLVCRFTTQSKRRHQDRLYSKSGGSEWRRSDSEDDGEKAAPTSPLKDESQAVGTTLHCVAISRICFKMGRITVPPAIVLACEGFSKPPDVGSYSHESPPPHWTYPHALRRSSEGLGVYQKFLVGGWKAVPEVDRSRWWVEPFSGPTEERRRANLEKLEVNDRAACCRDIF